MYLLINVTETSWYFGEVNMDLQPIIDDVAAVMYVCSYVTKGEKANGRNFEKCSKRMQECWYMYTDEQD